MDFFPQQLLCAHQDRDAFRPSAADIGTDRKALQTAVRVTFHQEARLRCKWESPLQALRVRAGLFEVYLVGSGVWSESRCFDKKSDSFFSRENVRVCLYPKYDDRLPVIATNHSLEYIEIPLSDSNAEHGFFQYHIISLPIFWLCHLPSSEPFVSFSMHQTTFAETIQRIE